VVRQQASSRRCPIVVLNTVILPVALLCVYGIATRIASGRSYFAALL
jgi:hypothetical protein